MAMNSLQKFHIFFFITPIAVILTTIIAMVVLCFLINSLKIWKIFQNRQKKVKHIIHAVDRFRKNIEQGEKIMVS